MANPLPPLLRNHIHKLNLNPRGDCALLVADSIASTLLEKMKIPFQLIIVAIIAGASLVCGQTEKKADEITFEAGFDYRVEFELQMVCIENSGHPKTPVVESSEFRSIPPEKLLGYGLQIGERKVHLNNIHEYWTELHVERDPTAALGRRGASIRPIPRSASYPDLVQQFMPAFRYRYERRLPGGSPTSYKPISAWSDWQILVKSPNAKEQTCEQASGGNYVC